MEGSIPKKRTNTEEIITKLREAEIPLAKGQTVNELCRQMGVGEQTYYRWRNEYGGLKIDQAKRRRAVEEISAMLPHSQQRICTVIGHARSTQRYIPSSREDELRLRCRLIAPAMQ